MVESPQIELAGDGRDLDRHVVNLGVLHQGQGALEAAGRLGLAQDRLAQQVDIQGVALQPATGQVGVDAAGGGVHHKVADEPSEATAGQWHDQLG